MTHVLVFCEYCAVQNKMSTKRFFRVHNMNSFLFRLCSLLVLSFVLCGFSNKISDKRFWCYLVHPPPYGTEIVTCSSNGLCIITKPLYTYCLQDDMWIFTVLWPVKLFGFPQLIQFKKAWNCDVIEGITRFSFGLYYSALTSHKTIELLFNNHSEYTVLGLSDHEIGQQKSCTFLPVDSLTSVCNTLPLLSTHITDYSI